MMLDTFTSLYLWIGSESNALYQHWPSTRGHVVYSDVATPLSNNFYLGTSRGEVYGLDHSTQRFDTLNAASALHPQTMVPGL